MSRIYITAQKIFSPRYKTRGDLLDRITELELQNELLKDKLDACMGFLESKNTQIRELKDKLTRAEKRIERLKFELAVADKSLDILTEKKDESKSETDPTQRS